MTEGIRKELYGCSREWLAKWMEMTEMIRNYRAWVTGQLFDSTSFRDL